MVRPSILFAGIFTFFSLLGSIIATAFSIYILLHCGTACQNSLFTFFITIDIFLSVFSLLALFCWWCKCDNSLFAYLSVMLLLIFVFAISIGIVFFFLNTDADKPLVLLREYRPGKNWNDIRSCSIDAQACRNLEKDTNQTTENFHKQDFSPVQSGCCEAPIDCGLGFKNTNHVALFWRTTSVLSGVIRKTGFVITAIHARLQF
ncbi:Tetraspanin [Melia azedarach]|uniref:Tetraspanin n=1 Tax=Melia azedarach TaxID=155640 RepID=A0ACC1XQW4_MELAZ|nr:Tetraspanin [Melia azedarach]